MTVPEMRALLVSDLDSIINASRLFVGSDVKRRAAACKSVILNCDDVVQKIINEVPYQAEPPEND